MTYDQWKTTDPREYEHCEEDQPTELDLVYEQLWEVKQDAQNAAIIAQKRIAELRASLAEMLSIYWGKGDGIEPAPACILRAEAALSEEVL